MFFSALVILAYVLSACNGVSAGQSINNQQDQSGQAQDVVFTGTIESVNGNQWTVSGQTITVADGATTGAIAVGDNVKVEAHVAPDGSITAVHVEVSGADNANANSNSSNGNDSNANGNVNDNTSNSNDSQGDNSNSSNGNSNGNGNDNSNTAIQQEVSGVVAAITTNSITIDGVTYMITDSTEFKNIIAMGDQVKVHVIVNADGSLTIREIEKTTQTGIDNGNSNSNSNGLDDNSNLNGNSNSNSNGDDKGGNTNGGNNNDDHGNDNAGGGDSGGGGNDNGGGGNGGG